MYKYYYTAIRHKESNWAKFLKQDLEGAVCAPAHLFHRVGNQLNCWVYWTSLCARFFIMKLNMPHKLFFIFSHVAEMSPYALSSSMFSGTRSSCF